MGLLDLQVQLPSRALKMLCRLPGTHHPCPPYPSPVQELHCPALACNFAGLTHAPTPAGSGMSPGLPLSSRAAPTHLLAPPGHPRACGMGSASLRLSDELGSSPGGGPDPCLGLPAHTAYQEAHKARTQVSRTPPSQKQQWASLLGRGWLTQEALMPHLLASWPCSSGSM